MNHLIPVYHRRFVADEEEMPQRQASFFQSARRISQWVKLCVNDLFFSHSLPECLRHNPKALFLDATLNRTSKWFSNHHVVTYISYLKKQRSEVPIKIVFGGLDLETNSEIEKEWGEVLKNKLPFVSEKYKIIVYPFSYPKQSMLNISDLVLVIADREKKTVFYYDPQGISCTDLSRKEIFSDLPNFDIKQNVLSFGQVLFKDDFKLINNTAIHSQDFLQSGIFICKVLHRLYEEIEPEEALHLDTREAIDRFRKQMGKEVLESLSLIDEVEKVCREWGNLLLADNL